MNNESKHKRTLSTISNNKTSSKSGSMLNISQISGFAYENESSMRKESQWGCKLT